MRRHGTYAPHRRRYEDEAEDTERMLPGPPPTGKVPEEKKKTKHAVSIEEGDSFSPLNDHSRLCKRNDYVRYFGDRKKQIFMRQLIWALMSVMRTKEMAIPEKLMADFAELRKHELSPTDETYARFVDTWLVKNADVQACLKEAYEAVEYRPMTGAKYAIRVLWIFLSGFGTVNKAWATLSQASYTVAITIVTSYLIQAETKGQELVNGLETWMDANQFLYNLFQMGVLVLGMLVGVQFVNYLGYCWKSHGRVLREARFNYIVERYKDQDSTMNDYTLDYNPDCDPDTAAVYFTLREEKNSKGGYFQTAFGRLTELLTLRVDRNLLKEMLKRDGIVISD